MFAYYFFPSIQDVWRALELTADIMIPIALVTFVVSLSREIPNYRPKPIDKEEEKDG